MALLNPGRLSQEERNAVAKHTSGSGSMTDFFVSSVARRIARVAAAFHPRPVIVLLSDLTSAAYARMIGGSGFEPTAATARCLRGAARYLSDDYRPAFELECQALYQVREGFGASNVAALVPHCCSPQDADRVLEIMLEQRLQRRKEGFRVHVRADDIPANAFPSSELLRRFDSVVLDPFALGEQLGLAGPHDDASFRVMDQLIASAHDANARVCVYGRALGAPGFVERAVQAGVDALSVAPEMLGATRERVRAVASRKSPAVELPRETGEPLAPA